MFHVGFPPFVHFVFIYANIKDFNKHGKETKHHGLFLFDFIFFFGLYQKK